MSGYDYDAGSSIYVGENPYTFATEPGIGLSPTVDVEGWGAFVVANAGTITIRPVVGIGTASSANVRMQASCSATPVGTSGLSGQTDGDSVGATTFATPSSVSSPNAHWDITNLDMTLSVAAGDIIRISTRRLGSIAADTYTGYLDLRGWRIFYA
jgi:hypothetical protein